MPPLLGRLKISQSRKLPQPPSETVPVPMPPSGNAISRSDSLVNRRPGMGRATAVRGFDCPRARPAAAEAASILRLVIFIPLPQIDVRASAPMAGMLPDGPRETVRANRGERGRPARAALPEHPPPAD